jgi:hypothetical protein
MEERILPLFLIYFCYSAPKRFITRAACGRGMKGNLFCVVAMCTSAVWLLCVPVLCGCYVYQFCVFSMSVFPNLCEAAAR